MILSELPERFRHLLQLLRERHVVLPALVPMAAAGVCRTAAICAAIVAVELTTGREATAARPRWAEAIWARASNAAELL